ncbi:hypothetical protein IM816_05765 [Luteibacter flocculans]|uniref:Uncharacterized protein n=1 Tax=Luteibacter flocculans TaxID=2780091 RepID=A0ABY4T3X0_9GAMM|nr:hypothetical protein [Luteibacter flocculans]URL59603.1 hypothetical protein IM816_05765 [Luteibacter flocculans]
MTITLSWWALPVAMVVLGLIALVWPSKSGGGYVDLSGLGQLAIFFVCLIIAVSICVGHWI